MEQQGFVGTEEATAVWEDSSSDVCAIDVYCWRMEQLLRAGYSHAVADCLAGNTLIDLHVACDLLARGCDQRVALRILS